MNSGFTPWTFIISVRSQVSFFHNNFSSHTLAEGMALILSTMSELGEDREEIENNIKLNERLKYFDIAVNRRVLDYIAGEEAMLYGLLKPPMNSYLKMKLNHAMKGLKISKLVKDDIEG